MAGWALASVRSERPRSIGLGCGRLAGSSVRSREKRIRHARSLYVVGVLGRGFDSRRLHQKFMKIHAIVHKAEEGGFWAEVPTIPGCATQGETMDELRSNLQEAIEGCLSVPVEAALALADDQVIELAL